MMTIHASPTAGAESRAGAAWAKKAGGSVNKHDNNRKENHFLYTLFMV
jgi:hypothetical protein